MGVRIGDSAQRLEAFRFASFNTAGAAAPRASEAAIPTVGFGSRSNESGAASTLFPEERPEPQRVGFGTGTVSAPAAALRTLDRNLAEAEKIVPTFEELQQEVRDRITREQERLARENPPTSSPATFDLREATTRASDTARGFVNGLNDAAGTARARLQGETPPETNRIDVRVGSEQVALTRSTQTPAFEFFA
ncbi:MAG: hypothetical protein AMXMBFR84_06340 [Candidatus Hydrogenedentota bacterium]